MQSDDERDVDPSGATARDPVDLGSDSTVAAAAAPEGPTTASEGDTLDARSAPITDGAGGSPVERYRLEEVIGRGGMGEVVTARDVQIGRQVAIKRMRAADATADARARFIREARIQGRLQHPAVVPVHELWRDDHGRPYFVMKQLTGGVTLLDVVGMLMVEDPETIAKFPRQRLLRAFTEVCLAVEFAHTRGVVHRDLKPANIMLGEFGEVYVLDWGIARVVGEAEHTGFSPGEIGESDATVAGTMMGTPGYMSPEQVRGDADLDGRADVYSLGCILFEILAHRQLHARGKAALEDALTGVDARPSVRAPDREVPPELDAACVAATAVDREQRPKSARELGEIVQRFLDGDRDIALRQTLARAELDIARAALEGGLLSSLEQSRRADRTSASRRDTIEVYKRAVRAAGRALALDPKSTDAAELLARLMLEPPAEIPPEVDDELAEYEKQQIASHARLGVRALLGYVIFFPIIYLGGIRDMWLVGGGAALTFAIMAIVYAISKRVTMPLVYASFVGNALLIVLYARGLTPLLVAPGVALITVMIYASHPRLGSLPILWGLCAAGVLVPLGLEAANVLATTTTVDGATIKMTLPADRLDPTIAIGGLAGYVAVILAIAALIARLQALHQRRMQRAIQLQAWQLRQLVPVRS